MKQTLKVMIIILLAGVFLFCAWHLGSYYFAAFQQEQTVDSLREQLDNDSEKNPYAVNADGILVRYAKLYAQNPDMIGWLTIADTRIDYPVMQNKKDPEYYLHRDFLRQYATDGSLFLDAACDLDPPSDNLIIYGHHMKSGNMFAKLMNYEDPSFYQIHKTFVFDTIYEHREYQVLAVFRTQAYAADDTRHFHYYDFIDGKGKSDFNDFVEQVKKRSQYDTGVSAKYGDELLTLSTCAYHAKEGRFVVIAKRMSLTKN